MQEFSTDTSHLVGFRAKAPVFVPEAETKCYVTMQLLTLIVAVCDSFMYSF